MSRRLPLIAFAILYSFSCVAVMALAQEAPVAPADQQKMMQEYIKLMSPGPNHEYFNGLVGDWDVVTTTWMMPGAETGQIERLKHPRRQTSQVKRQTAVQRYQIPCCTAV